jgi:hypothetical protein
MSQSGRKSLAIPTCLAAFVVGPAGLTLEFVRGVFSAVSAGSPIQMPSLASART